MESGRGLTRRDFDEIIRRAAELAASEPDGGEGGLTEGELFRIAAEVGLEERHVQKALVQVRSAPPSRGPVSAVFGPAHLSVSRVVPGTKEHLSKVLDEFLVAGRLLQPVRRGGSVLHYRPAVDWASQIARAASATSRRYYVAAAKKVEIRMEEAGDGSTRVEFEVEPGTRDDYMVGGFLGGGVAGVGLGMGVGTAMATVAPLALGVAAGVTAGLGMFSLISWISGRYHRKRLLEVRAEVEGVLDALELGESLEPPPPSWRRWVKRHFHGVAREMMGPEDRDGPKGRS
jgi:hypothetical protein